MTGRLRVTDREQVDSGKPADSGFLQHGADLSEERKVTNNHLEYDQNDPIPFEVNKQLAMEAYGDNAEEMVDDYEEDQLEKMAIGGWEEETAEDIESYLIKSQRKFVKYRLNIFFLNKVSARYLNQDL